MFNFYNYEYMKYFRYILFAIFFGGIISSCNFLDKEPYELTPETYFNTAEEVNSFLTGIYAILGQSSVYGENFMYLTGGDDLQHYGGASTRSPATKGLICANTVTSDPAVTGMWFTLYAGINRANMLLENIDRVEDIDDDLKAQYISEARFLRAFYYYTLVQNWGDVPFRDEATNTVVGLDIPRTDRQDIYDFIVKEMAEVADPETGGLLSAEELGYKPGRVSRSAAWAMLARVYLFRAGEHFREKRTATQDELTTYFSEASKYAQKVMSEGHKLAENYWDVFIDMCSNEYNTTANESIWEVEFAGNNTSDTRTEGRWGNNCGLAGPDLSNETDVVGKNDPGYSYEFIFATPKLYDLYVANGDYERFYWNIAPFKYVEKDGKSKVSVTGRYFYNGTMDKILNEFNNWGRGTYSYGDAQFTNGEYNQVGDYENPSVVKDKGRPCAKYRREYEDDKKDKNYTSINFPLMRYSDVLLMIAEAENEVNGPNTLAYQCINEVRSRAGISTLKEGSLDQDEFRQAVKDERAMELCFEFTRRYDLIRWGEFTKNMSEMASLALSAGDEWKQSITNNVYTYFSNVTDAYNYFPIPDQEMSVNKSITENNPGW